MPIRIQDVKKFVADPDPGKHYTYPIPMWNSKDQVNIHMGHMYQKLNAANSAKWLLSLQELDP